MYSYVEDKEFLSKTRSDCGEMMQELCHLLKETYEISARFYLVGSGAKNLIMQNENNPIDLDYNLEIVKCEDFSDCRGIKESVRKAFYRCIGCYLMYFPMPILTIVTNNENITYIFYYPSAHLFFFGRTINFLI